MAAELDDLVRLRLLTVVRYSDRESVGRNPHLCGTTWSVNLTERAIRTFWGHRLSSLPGLLQFDPGAYGAICTRAKKSSASRRAVAWSTR